MSQAVANQLKSLNDQWMEAHAVHQRNANAFFESQKQLDEIDFQVEKTWYAFHIALQEEIDAVEENRYKSAVEQNTPIIFDDAVFDDAVKKGLSHFGEDIPTPKEAARSARSQARRPLIGNKSGGGCARVVKSENGNKRFKTTVTQGGEDVYTRPDQHSQRVGGKVRGMVRGTSPDKGFYYFTKEEEPEQHCDVYTSFAFKKQRKEEKKNKSQRDRIFIE
jgi:hypothetical protein